MVPMFPLQTLLLGGEVVGPWEIFVNVADCVCVCHKMCGIHVSCS